MSLFKQLEKVRVARERVAHHRGEMTVPAAALLERGYQHPLTTMGAAAGAGFVLGSLGVGPLRVPGLISTVIFALPAPIRLTQLGISSVPKSLLEAGEAFGATRLQMLWKVELPSAAPTIIAGITQCIMLSLSMVVIAALVGAGGLGVPVVRALNTVQVGMGFEAGFVIVLLAIILDRISRPADKESNP